MLDLDWFFREQPISDQGIDAHAEEAPEEEGNGRLLALQIKSGPSWFREEADEGWVFRFDQRHAQLWLGHGLPVILVLVDPADPVREVGFWQHISAQTVVSTGKNFKVIVPRTHRLPDAAAAWSHIASGVESRARSRWDLAITQIPPGVASTVKRVATDAPLDAAVLALHLAEGRSNPRGTVRSLLATKPAWITAHADRGWSAVAAYAAEHDVLDLSSAAFELAAAASPNRGGQLLAAAAINAAHYSRRRARTLLARAEGAADHSLITLIARAYFDHPVGDAGPRFVHPDLRSDQPGVRGNVAVQLFLSDQATRGKDFDAACTYAKRATEADPQSTSAMVEYGESLARRASTMRGQEGDVAAAVRALRKALDQRRGWSGPTTSVLAQLMRALLLAGRYEEAVRQGMSGPDGAADPEEAKDPLVLRLALHAARGARRRDTVHQIAAQMGSSVQDKVALLRAGVLELDAGAEERLWGDELDRARAVSDFEAMTLAIFDLARFGIDRSKEMSDLAARSIVPAHFPDLAAALALGFADLDASLPQLRSLARSDAMAAERLLQLLHSAGRQAEGAQICEQLHQSTGQPIFLLSQVQMLLDASDWAAAETAAVDAVAVLAPSDHPTERAELIVFLASRAEERGDLVSAEAHLGNALSLSDTPVVGWVWRLVHVLLRQGRVDRAGTVIQRRRPPVATVDQARLWLNALTSTAWDEGIASQALAMAKQFNDPDLSTALLGRIVMSTRAPAGDTDLDDPPDPELEARRKLAQGVVPAELHRQAFEALSGLVEDFGDETGVRVLTGSDDELVEQMIDVLKQSADAGPWDEIVQAAREAKAPLGFLATLRGRGYATGLVQRALGVLIAGAADDEEHEAEVEAAAEALGATVVVEASALLTLTGLENPGRLDGQFTGLLMPGDSVRDVFRAASDVRAAAGSPGSMSWDAEGGHVILHELTATEYSRQLRRVDALEAQLDLVTPTSVGAIDQTGRLGEDPEHRPWLAPLQLAYDRGAALWCDDLALRRLARHLGLEAFGTPALLDAVRDRALQSATDASVEATLTSAADAIRDLAADYVVDVAVHLADLLVVAERDDWHPGAGAVVIARASWWAWQEDPIADLVDLYASINSHRPESLEHWQTSAMVGAARAFQAAGVSEKILAVIALLGLGGHRDAEIVAASCARARRVAEDLGLGDPVAQLPAAAVALTQAGHGQDFVALAETELATLVQDDAR